MTTGSDFYDEEDVFDYYMKSRQRATNPNDTIEKPAFMDVLGDFKDKHILDLGCGAGGFGVELIKDGCASYTGVEASARMATIAKEQLEALGGTLHESSMEMWNYPKNTFDIVISRLALHYIDDVSVIFEQVRASLKPNGRFIFTVEHPVLTSHNEALVKTGGKRLNWIVDNYFLSGERDITWMGSNVLKYHRTIEDYFIKLQQAGFTIQHLREPRPQRELFADEAEYKRRMRIPLFLLLSGQASI